MATKTVINTSGMPQGTQCGISITIDQDQAQKAQDIQLDAKRQWQQTQHEPSSEQTTTATNLNKNWNDVEVSTRQQQEVSPNLSAQAKTFIDINRNNIMVNGHHEQANSHYHDHRHQYRPHNHHHHYRQQQHHEQYRDVDKETGYTTITQTTLEETVSTFPHINQKESTQDFGERGKLALVVVGEKIEIPKATNDNFNNHHNDDDDGDNDVHGILVGKSPIQTNDVVAPIEIGVVGISGTNEESTNRSSNGTTITNIDEVQHVAKKALSDCVKKTIIQCNVGNDNVSNGNDDDHHRKWHNEESVRVCSGDTEGDARNDDDVDDDGQLLCYGLRNIDINSQRQSKLNDVSAVPSNFSCLTKADCASAVKQTFEYDADSASHVVKIQIKPSTDTVNASPKTDKQVTVVQVNENPLKEVEELSIENEIINEILNKTELNLNLDKMVQKPPTTSLASVTQNGHGHGHNSITSGNTTVTELNVTNPSYHYYTMSSGQFSPCDTLDSGTGSDLESNGTSGTPITIQSSKGIIDVNGGVNGCKSDAKVITNGNSAPKLELHLKTTKIRVNNGTTKSGNKQNGEHARAGSLTDSEESETSSLSCDSLHSTEFIRQSSTSPSANISPKSSSPSKMLSPFLPDSLLRDIRDRKFPTNDFEAKYGNQESLETVEAVETAQTCDSIKTGNVHKLAEEIAEHTKFLQECKVRDNESNGKRASLPPCKTFILNSENGTFIDTKMNSMPRKYEADKYYNFHVHEHENFHSFSHGNSSNSNGNTGTSIHDDETSLPEYDMKNGIRDDDFAGYRDIRCSSPTSTIRSSKGTVRGVKNRVRNGIATFLQMQQPHLKNFIEKDVGKVVLYTTSMGIIRDTYAKCSNIKKILRTLLIKFEERDVFMSVEYQAEIKNRMKSSVIRVPQLFVEGQHIGDAETVERLNESGELRQLLKPYKCISTAYTCQTCGGYRLLPCPSCNGSKKSVHRNHFTAEFVALKCMNCDEVGLVKCHNC